MHHPFSGAPTQRAFHQNKDLDTHVTLFQGLWFHLSESLPSEQGFRQIGYLRFASSTGPQRAFHQNKDLDIVYITIYQYSVNLREPSIRTRI